MISVLLQVQRVCDLNGPLLSSSFLFFFTKHQLENIVSVRDMKVFCQNFHSVDFHLEIVLIHLIIGNNEITVEMI